jgi:hypothetical protein
MTGQRLISRLLLPAAAAAILEATPALADPMPMDNPVTLNGIETVCTGIADSKDDPRWKTYPVRIEFSNGGAQYLAGAHVELSQGTKQLTSLDCSASWVLFKLSPGNYSVTATLLDSNAKPREAKFSPPKSGQKRIVLRFPDFQANQ